MTLTVLDILAIAVMSMLMMMVSIVVTMWRAEGRNSPGEMKTEQAFGAVLDASGRVLKISAKEKSWNQYVGHHKSELDAAIQTYIETGVVPPPTITPHDWNA